MKMRNIKALLLALMMLGSMLLMCACNGNEGPTTGGEPTSANVNYKVSLKDMMGTPYNANIVVSFMQNGEAIGMVPVDENGVAAKELPRGEYTVELMMTDGKSYHYSLEDIKLTADAPEATVEMALIADNGKEVLNVGDEDCDAPYVLAGCTYLELVGGKRNYFIFTPRQTGIYEFTLHNVEGTIDYYGSTFFVSSNGTATPSGEQAVTMEVKDGMVSSGNTGTVDFVMGIDVAEGVTDCIVSIVRIGDYKPAPNETEWVNHTTSYKPAKYTLPEGQTIAEFDLTSSYNLVFNENDGFYHLDSVDGPVVLVRMNAELTYGGSFGTILANGNVGVYEYDENGEFIQRVSFNGTLLKYLGVLTSGMGSFSYENGNLDEAYGVYPLTEELMYIIQTYGEYTGWWNQESSNYLFAAVPGLNVESAWLFMCCYAQ